MATLLDGVTADTGTTGTGTSHTGPATVFVRGTFDGATVLVQVSDEGVAASFVKADNVSTRSAARLGSPGVCSIDVQGTYFIRCIVENAGSSTDITAISTQ